MFKKSDLLFVPPTGEVAKRIEALRARLKLLVELQADNVFPGQPIIVNWRFNLGPSAEFNTVNAKFLIDDKPVHELTNVSLSSALGGTGAKVTTITLADPSLAKPVYRTGHKRLQLEIRRSDTDVYRGRASFRVVPERVDGTWWKWREDHGTVEWKKPYVLAGHFENRCHAAIATLSVEFVEGETPVFPCDSGDVLEVADRKDVAAGSQAPFAFTVLHDWKWLMDATYVLHGPIKKYFNYGANFAFSDEYGNNYGFLCSGNATRKVAVSDTKLAAGFIAMNAAAQALVLGALALAALASLIGAIAGAALGAAAAVAYGVAAGAGVIAKDPPEPDPNFREPVEVPARPVRPWPTAPNLRMDALRKLLESALRLIALEETRSVVRGRMMGARAFGDELALALQRRTYETLAREMSGIASDLERLLPEVQAEVEQNDALDPKNLHPWIDRVARTGLPWEVQELVLRAGVPVEDVGALGAFTADPEFVEVVAANGLFLVTFVAALRSMVNAIEAEHHAILSGYDVFVPPPLNRVADDEREESDMIRRPSARCAR